MIEQLRYLDEEHSLISPIMVKVAASRENGGDLYVISIVHLRNELIFGIGRTKSLAYQMLRTELKKYYDFLMSSNLDRYHNSDYVQDKCWLERIIEKHESTI